MQFNYKIKYNYFLIGIGCIFLFNGNLNIFDFLPDFIGYILIVIGTGHLFLVSEKFDKARKAAYYLIFVTLVKFVLSFFTSGFAGEDYLLVTAVFNIVEFLLAYNLFKNLFGMTELYFEMNDSYNDAHDSAFYGKFMKIFLCVKYILGVLAEMTVLINPDFLDRLYFNNNITIEASDLKRAAGLIGVIIVTLFGLFMLTVIPPHFYRLHKNEAVNDKLRMVILSVENKDVKIKLRKFGMAFLLLYISAFCLFDLKMDGILVLPDVLSAIAVFSVLVIFKTFFTPEEYKKAAVTVSALTILTAASFALNIFTAATETERAFSETSGTMPAVVSAVLTIAGNALFSAVYIYIFKSAEKLRISEMNFAGNSKGLFIPQTEREKKINPSAANAFIISAFAVKSLSVLNITYSIFPTLYFTVCVFYVIFSIYKLDKIRTSIRYYYNEQLTMDG